MWQQIKFLDFSLSLNRNLDLKFSDLIHNSLTLIKSSFSLTAVALFKNLEIYSGDNIMGNKLPGDA